MKHYFFYFTIFIVFNGYLPAQCTGCNHWWLGNPITGYTWPFDCGEDWVGNLDSCNQQDVNVLQDIIDVNPHLQDFEPLDLGIQSWHDGRLTYYNATTNGLTTSNGPPIPNYPESFGNLSELLRFYSFHNEMTIFPEGILNLSQLEYLIIWNSNLEYIPEAICDLPNLQSINVQHNFLSEEFHYDCINHWEPQYSLTISNKLLPKSYYLAEPYPNPFNPTTMISYSLPIKTEIELTVYDISGRKLVELYSGKQKAGTHTLEWNAGHLPSGVYFVKLIVGEFSQTQKAVLVK